MKEIASAVCCAWALRRGERRVIAADRGFAPMAYEKVLRCAWALRRGERRVIAADRGFAPMVLGK